MNRYLIASISMATLFLSVPHAAAQWPAGTPRDDTGSRASQMGIPTPQEKLETHRNEQGQIVTEDGRPVEGLSDSESVPNRNLHRTEQDTVTADPPHQSATPGELE